MNQITVSATDFKNNIAEYMNLASYGGKTVVVKKYGIATAKLIPVGEKKQENIEEKLKKVLLLAGGFKSGKNYSPKELNKIFEKSYDE